MEGENQNNKKKKIVIVFFIAIGVILLVLISLILTGTINFKSSISNNNQPSNDIIDNDNNKTNGNKSYIAGSSQDFINYLNSIDYNDYGNYEIICDKIKINIETNDSLPGYDYSIYYDNSLLESYQLLENNYLINGGKFYLLSESENNAFVIVNEIGPVAAHSRYLILAIDFKGNTLMNQQVLPLPSDTIEVSNNKIKYSYQTKMQEEHGLNVAAGVENDFCEYLKSNYEDDYIVTGTKEYQFTNGELSLIEDNKNTIKNYKEKYNCN